MKTYKIYKTENQYLETITFKLLETEIVDGKRYTEEIAEFKDEQAAISKMRFQQHLYGK